MDQREELVIFIILISVVLMILIGGVIAFLYQYRKRRITHIAEITVLDEQHKQALLTAQIDIQKETMMEIGKELHDNVGQKVTLASIYLQQIPYKHEENPALSSQITEVNVMLNELLTELRHLSKSLVEQENLTGDFYNILKTEFQKIESLTHLKINFKNEYKKIDLWTLKERNAIFRIIQEFIQNSLKHGKAKSLDIVISEEGKNAVITAKDDGIGFDKEQVTMGIGITNLKRRALDIGGNFSIDSTPGVGTKIAVIIPPKGIESE